MKKIIRMIMIVGVFMVNVNALTINSVYLGGLPECGNPIVKKQAAKIFMDNVYYAEGMYKWTGVIEDVRKYSYDSSVEKVTCEANVNLFYGDDGTSIRKVAVYYTIQMIEDTDEMYIEILYFPN